MRQIKKRYNIFGMGVYKRSLILLVLFQMILWIIFGLSYFLHQEAWINNVQVPPETAAVGNWFSTFFYILFMNSIICLFIVIGNIFVRFNLITPGLVVLLIQAISIGWLAGSNGFEVPFISVKEANLQFFKIGFWETTAYVLACSITLPKSLYIANTFPAKQWDTVRKFRELKLSKKEQLLVIICAILLVSAAVIETVFIYI